jgi:hypothetical protein
MMERFRAKRPRCGELGRQETSRPCRCYAHSPAMTLSVRVQP